MERLASGISNKKRQSAQRGKRQVAILETDDVYYSIFFLLELLVLTVGTLSVVPCAKDGIPVDVERLAEVVLDTPCLE